MTVNSCLQPEPYAYERRKEIPSSCSKTIRDPEEALNDVKVVERDETKNEIPSSCSKTLIKAAIFAASYFIFLIPPLVISFATNIKKHVFFKVSSIILFPLILEVTVLLLYSVIRYVCKCIKRRNDVEVFIRVRRESQEERRDEAIQEERRDETNVTEEDTSQEDLSMLEQVRQGYSADQNLFEKNILENIENAKEGFKASVEAIDENTDLVWFLDRGVIRSLLNAPRGEMIQEKFVNIIRMYYENLVEAGIVKKCINELRIIMAEDISYQEVKTFFTDDIIDVLFDSLKDAIDKSNFPKLT